MNSLHRTRQLQRDWARSGAKTRVLCVLHVTVCWGWGVDPWATLTVRPSLPSGICPVNRDTIDYLLSKNGSGNAIIIVVGGAAESLSSMPGKNAVTLRNRKGFVKLALRHG